MNLKLEELKKLIQTLEDGKVSEFEYEDEASRLRLVLGAKIAHVAALPAAPAPAVHAAAPPAASASAAGKPALDEANVAYVTSPLVGTFYRSPSPESDVFTDVGQTVKPGQVLCIVEAMKLMNEIESEVSGTVVEVLVQNGTSVEFGQKLFKIKKG